MHYLRTIARVREREGGVLDIGVQQIQELDLLLAREFFFTFLLELFMHPWLPCEQLVQNY